MLFFADHRQGAAACRAVSINPPAARRPSAGCSVVPPSARRDAAFRKTILQIPRGKVATYGQVAAAAGYPLYHRHVAQLLSKSGGRLP